MKMNNRKMKNLNLLSLVIMLLNINAIALGQEKKDSIVFPELPKPIVETMELYQNLCYSNVILNKESAAKSTKIETLQDSIKELNDKICRLNKDLSKYSNKDKIEAEIKQKSDLIGLLESNVANLLDTIRTNKQNEASLLMKERTKGRQDVKLQIEQFYTMNSFDEIIDQTSISVINLHKNLLSPLENESIKLVLEEIEIYFNVKDKLKTKSTELDFVKFQNDLQKITSKSDRVNSLKLLVIEGGGDLKRMSKMLNDLSSFNKTRIANDANTTLQKRALLYEKIDYFCFNIGYRNLNWPYLDGYINELRKRISKDANIEIDDILLEFK
jgi:hypothetical protein